jgi:hypothetical protein
MIQRFLGCKCAMSPCYLVIFVCFALTGCSGSNPVSKANYERIKSGMTESDADRILGKGKDISADEVEQVLKRLATPSTGSNPLPAAKQDADLSSLKGVRWGTEKKSITIIYREGRVYKLEPQGL